MSGESGEGKGFGMNGGESDSRKSTREGGEGKGTRKRMRKERKAPLINVHWISFWIWSLGRVESSCRSPVRYCVVPRWSVIWVR